MQLIAVNYMKFHGHSHGLEMPVSTHIKKTAQP